MTPPGARRKETAATASKGIGSDNNERGIVLTVEGHGEHPARRLFYPWGAVFQLSEASD